MSDRDLEEAVRDKKIIELGKLNKSVEPQDISRNLSKYSINTPQNIETLNLPIGIDFQKYFSPKIYLSSRNILEELGSFLSISKQLRYQIESLYLFLSQGKLEDYSEMFEKIGLNKPSENTNILDGILLLIQHYIPILNGSDQIWVKPEEFHQYLEVVGEDAGKKEKSYLLKKFAENVKNPSQIQKAYMIITTIINFLSSLKIRNLPEFSKNEQFWLDLIQNLNEGKYKEIEKQLTTQDLMEYNSKYETKVNDQYILAILISLNEWVK